jgi:pyruvate, orthophosphate dikinase
MRIGHDVGRQRRPTFLDLPRDRLFGVSPFEILDADGVGELVRIGTGPGRAARPDLRVGARGEHGGDPDPKHYLHQVGLDYVSIARLEAGRGAPGREQ